MRCDLRESWPNAIDTIRSESRCFMTAAESDASWRGLRSIGCRLQTKRAYDSMTIRTRIRIISTIITINQNPFRWKRTRRRCRG